MLILIVIYISEVMVIHAVYQQCLILTLSIITFIHINYC